MPDILQQAHMLMQACKRWQRIVYLDAAGWQARCRADWGIQHAHPSACPRLQAGMLQVVPDEATEPPTADAQINGALLTMAAAGHGLRASSAVDVLRRMAQPTSGRDTEEGISSPSRAPRFYSLREDRHVPAVSSVFEGETGTCAAGGAASHASQGLPLTSEPGAIDSASSQQEVPPQGNAWRAIYRDRVQVSASSSTV
jgi:hypothetical protein